MSKENSITLHYTPNINFCDTPFVVVCDSEEGIVRIAVALELYQKFLFENNHSRQPASSVYFTDRNKEFLPSLVKDFSGHKYMQLSSVDDLASCDDAEEWGVRLLWFPQAPCKSFKFPVKNEHEALALTNIIAAYDQYLLELCTQMRCEYNNFYDLEFRPTDFAVQIKEGLIDPESGGWTSWYYFNEKEDVYYDSFHEFVMNTDD